MPRGKDYSQLDKLKEMGVALADEQEYLGFRVKHKFRCLTCNEGEWETKPQTIKQQYTTLGSTGCPICKIGHTEKKKAEKRDELDIDDRLKEAGAKLLSVYTGFMYKHDVECLTPGCGHKWNTSINNLISSHLEKVKQGRERTNMCPACHERDRSAGQKWAGYRRVREQHELDGMDELLRYSEAVRILTEKNKRKYHLELDPERKRTMHNKGEYSIDHKVSVQSCFYAGISVEEAASLDNLRMMTMEENNSKGTKLIWDLVPTSFEQRIRDNLHRVDPVGYVKQQLELRGAVFTELSIKRPRFQYSFVINGVVVRILNSRKDIIQPGNTVMFDALGYYNSRGYRYIQILDLEIREHPEWVVDELDRVLELSAKQEIDLDDVREISEDELSEIDDVQGDHSSSIKIGGFYQGKLITAMGFNKATKMTSNKVVGDHGWDLSRFVTDVNYSIPGAAGKLLKFFERNFEWTSIVSHADKRWSVGDLYQKLGFEMFDSGDPGYFYIWNGKKYSRNRCTKANLAKNDPDFDPALPESHYAEKMGAIKVYDCGVLTCLKVK